MHLLYVGMYLSMCVGVCEITDIEDSWGNHLHPLGREALEEAFHALKTTSFETGTTDSSAHAELTPWFSLNVLPL